jgi:ABC-type Na+ efflux pump permease subunit
MRITPLIIAKRNLIRAYHNRSIIYSVFFPAIFLIICHMQISTQVTGVVIGLAFVLGSLDDALFSISREMDDGTLAKLFLSPVSRWSIIGGRALSSFILGALKVTLVVLTLTHFMNLIYSNLISLALFYVISFLTILLTVLLGIICSTLFRVFKTAVLLASSVIFLFALSPVIVNNSFDNNPFWMCYNVFTYILKADYTSMQTPIFTIFMLVIALFLIAGVTLRRKIA